MILLNFIDLFCGCGGFSYGFKQTGFEHLFGLDAWEGCRETYEKNIGKFVLRDIREFDGNEWKGKIDVVIGSPPCQEFSIANPHRDINEGMKLVNEFYRVVSEIQPKVWIMENVPMIFKIDGIRGFKHIFNANDFGVIQNRVRCFISNIPLKPKMEDKIFLDGQQALKYCVKAKSRIHSIFNTVTTQICNYRSQAFMDVRGLRFPTVEEIKSIMSFPFNYEFLGEDVWRQLGNAVPPLMSYRIALSVKETIM